MSSEDLIREAQDPATDPARLAELAQIDRTTWAAIVFNPSAYDGLLQWLGERGDPTVNAALAARASHAATMTQPAAPDAPPVPQAPPVVAPVAETPVVEPEPTPEPVEEQAAAQPPVEEPTTYIPAAPTQSVYQPEPTHQPEPTTVLPAQPAAPVHPTYPAGADYPVASTAAFGSAPPAGTEHQATATDSGGGGSGRPIAFVIAMVAVIIALIGGAAFGATELFGDDDDGPDITATDSKTSDAPDSSDQEEDDQDQEEDDQITPSPAEEDDDSDSGSGASSEFCQAAREGLEATTKLLDDGQGNLDAIKQTAGELADQYESLGDSAPDDLKDDVQVMQDYFELLSDPPADIGSKLGEAIPAYTEAASNVGSYYTQNCF